MIVENLKHGRKVFDQIAANTKKDRYIVIDTETQPKHPYTGKKDALIIGRPEIVIWSLCHRGVSYSFPTSAFTGAYPSMEEWCDLLAPYVSRFGFTKVFHNANYDICVFRTSTSLTNWSNVYCTMIGGWLAREYVDKSLKERAPYYDRYIQKTATIDFTNLEELATYAEMDVIVTDEMFQMQQFGSIRRSAELKHIDVKGREVVTTNEFVVANHGIKSGHVDVVIEGEALTDWKKMLLQLQELPVLRANIQAEITGFPIDSSQLYFSRIQMANELQSLLKKIFGFAGKTFNLNSVKQLAEVLHSLGVHSPDKTKSGAESFSEKSLKKIYTEHEIVPLIMAYRGLAKLQSVYLGDGEKSEGLLAFTDPRGVLHPTVNSVGAVTGRASSCVAPDTLIETEFGQQKIADIELGTRVVTHRGRLRPVLDKYYKGIQPMFRYHLSNGGMLEATKEHRVFIEGRFLALAECSEGDMVSSYVSKQAAVKRSEADKTSSSDLQKADSSSVGGHCQDSGNRLRDYPSDSAVKHAGRSSERAAETEVCGVETRRQESDEGKVWKAESKLQGGVFGLQRVSDKENRRQKSVCASSSVPEGIWSGEATTGICGSSYRRRQVEQQDEQSGFDEELSSHKVALSRAKIVKIEPIGLTPVWDIHVKEDESYLAGNFVSHNSSPNAQQIPSRKDTVGIKACFVANNELGTLQRKRIQHIGRKEPQKAIQMLEKLEEKGRTIVCIDYSQLEIRVMALFCKDPVMTTVLCDPKGDIHQTTADHFGVPRNPAAKNLNFLLLYGGQEYMLSETLSAMDVPTTPDQAKAFIKAHAVTYPRVTEFRSELLDEYRQKGYIKYFTGRTRTLEDQVDWHNRYQRHKAETTLSNNLIQGTGQDFLKAAVARLDYRQPLPDQKILSSKTYRSKFTKQHISILKELIPSLTRMRDDLRKAKCEYLLQVHDELIFSVDAKGAEDCLHHIADIMCMRHFIEGTTDYSVPLAAEGGIGLTWKQAKGDDAMIQYEARMPDKWLF